MNAVRDALLRTSYLAPYINQADKVPFGDGGIFIYKNESQTKADFSGRVSTQVKGKEVAGIRKEEIKYSVKAADLHGYLKLGFFDSLERRVRFSHSPLTVLGLTLTPL